MTYLFLDTNIYLHYQDFEQLPWNDILSVTDELSIIIPPVIISEIDKIKDQGTGKVNKRARKISPKLGDILLEGISCKIKISSCADPKRDDFETYNLDREIADDRFILSALLFSDDGQKKVIVVARDNMALIKAKNKGLKYKRMSDEYLLKEELSKEEKELAEVKKQLALYVNRLSAPSLTFDNGETFMKIKKPASKDVESIIQKAIKEEKEAVSHYLLPDESSDEDSNPFTAMTSSISASIKALQPNPEQVKRYNTEVDEYHKEFEEYIRLKISRDVLKDQLCKLKFILANKGNAPTGDLDIFIYFPDNVNLYNRTSQKHIDIDNPPLKPEQSSFVFSAFDRATRKQLQSIQSNSFIPHPLGGVIDNRPRIWDLSKTIKRHNYHFDRAPLSQTLQYSIDFKYGIYIDLMQCGNFSIGYSIVDTSIPKPIDGLLSVIVE